MEKPPKHSYVRTRKILNAGISFIISLRTSGNAGFWVKDTKSVANTYFWTEEEGEKYPRSREIPYI